MAARKKIDSEILRRLGSPQDSFISGEVLARGLGISRTAVWKHVSGLKARGFPIESLPSKGYRLGGPLETFNKLSISAGMPTELIGQEIHFFDTLPSTNERAALLAIEGEPEGSVVICDTQTNGRGRLGRSWSSPPGVNLYASIILRPRAAVHELQGITLLGAVAVAETVALFSKKTPSVKWPNDVLLDSKKVAGILMEMHTEGEMARFVVAGIGVNLNMDPRLLPNPLNREATSIRNSGGRAVPRADFTRALFLSLELWYKTFLKKGLSAIIEAWRGYFLAEGKPVEVRSHQKTVKGICLGVDNFGALLIRDSSGVTKKVLSGDLVRGT
ncbi:MAG: biotin--[acetyl-CoA-carboxylase] ligase [Thermodesulfobacteriota bacterium]